MTIIDAATESATDDCFSLLSVWPLAQLVKMSAMTARRIESDEAKLYAERAQIMAKRSFGMLTGEEQRTLSSWQDRIARQQAIKAAIDREIEGRG